MPDISNQTLVIVIGVAFVISLVSLFSLPDGFLSISGLLVDTGQARINVTELASLNVSHPFIDFGNGTIESGYLNCTLTSETPATPDPLNCWTGSGARTGGFEAVNVGNVNLNVSISATHNGSNSTAFWDVLNGKYLWKCVGNGTSEISVYTEVDNTSTRCIHTLPPTAETDAFSVHLNLTIPPTAVGMKNDTITFTAEKT